MKRFLWVCIAIFLFHLCKTNVGTTETTEGYRMKPEENPVDLMPKVNSKEFEKVIESNFIGRWQGQYLGENAEILSIDLEVKRTEGDGFLCQLSVPNSQILLYKTEYLMGRNAIEGEGFSMQPILAGFAEFQVKNHPLIPAGRSVKLTLVADLPNEKQD